MNNDARLLLVAGFPSGGTDLMKNLLNAHPEVFVSGEVPFLARLADSGFQGGEAPLSAEDIARLQRVIKESDVYDRVGNPAAAAKLAAEGRQLTLQDAVFEMVTDRPARVRGFKTPQFTEQMDELARLFPEALFVVVVRDIRDVCLSWEKKWGKDKFLCADKWRRRMRSGWDVARQLSGERALFVSYERILADTETVCREVCDLAEIPFDEAMLEHHRFVAPEDGKINYDSAIVKDNADKWRALLSERDARRVEEIAYPTLELFGYHPAYATGPRSITKYEHYRGLARDIYAMLFVGNRRMSLWNNLRSRFLNLFIEFQKRR